MKNINKDQLRYANSGGKGFFKAWKFPGFRFLYFMRMTATYSKAHPFGILARFFFRNMQRRYGFQIPHYAKIGGGLYMGHYGGIVVSSQAEIGENCNIAQGVTIGRINKGPRKGAPKIGDRVWIGPNSVLVGNIKIGNEVMIAPLTFVNQDIPDRCLVIGNPARIIEGKDSSDYITIYS